MKQDNDSFTLELPLKKRGRPRLYDTDAARVAAHRARSDLVTLSVDLPSDVVDGLNEYMRFKNLSKRAVLEKLIRSQLLRKR